MLLNDVNLVVQKVAKTIEGTVLKKEYLKTNSGLYLFLHTVELAEDLPDLQNFLSQNNIKPILVISKDDKYEIDDELEIESSVFNLLKTEVLAIQGNYLLYITNGKIVNKRLISKNVL